MHPVSSIPHPASRSTQHATHNLQSPFGFTLLEIMVAISIIAIVLVAVYKMHSQTIYMSTNARFYTTAPLLAQKKMAEIELRSNEQTDGSGDFGDEFPGYKWRVSIDDVESEALGDAAEDLKKIDVTVSFNDDELTYSFRTYGFLYH